MLKLILVSMSDAVRFLGLHCRLLLAKDFRKELIRLYHCLEPGEFYGAELCFLNTMKRAERQGMLRILEIRKTRKRSLWMLRQQVGWGTFFLLLLFDRNNARRLFYFVKFQKIGGTTCL